MAGKAGNAGDVERKVRAEGACRLCRRAGTLRPLTRHRVVPGSLGGRYVPANVVPLCRACHDLVDRRDERTRRSARRMLRASMWPVEISTARFLYATRGKRFDQAYPVPPRELVVARRNGESLPEEALA